MEQIGKLLCQWASHQGATVIGTVGSQEKISAAQAAGCAHVIVCREQDIIAEVKRITGTEGVHVVYDSIGKDTFDKSLDCLRPVGLMVNFGQASGPVPPMDISVLAQKGSILLAKPTLATFVKTPESIRALAEGVFQARHPASATNTSRMIRDRGHMGWQKAVGYGRRSHAETAMFRFKAIIGSSLRARTLPAQNIDAKVACSMLNRMTRLGRPMSRWIA